MIRRPPRSTQSRSSAASDVYKRQPANHQTISGPDNWVILNNGADRVSASWAFLKWFTDAKQQMYYDLQTGALPIRQSQQQQPAFQTYLTKYPGTDLFVKNMSPVSYTHL